MAYSLYEMTAFDLQMDYWPVIWTGVMQGFGMGFVFVPLSTMAFATIAPAFRADGTSMFALVRNMGQGVGISIVTAVLSNMMQVNHQELGDRLTATSQAVRDQMPSLLTGDPTVVTIMNNLVTQQSAMMRDLTRRPEAAAGGVWVGAAPASEPADSSSTGSRNRMGKGFDGMAPLGSMV
eukprot:gene47816-64850_t